MRAFGRIALTALAVLAVGALAFAGETQVARGKVKAVSGKTVTVAVEGGMEWTFEVTQGAQVIAEGATHKSEALSSVGRKTVIDDFVRENQHVTVHYWDENGTRYVKKLRVH